MSETSPCSKLAITDVQRPLQYVKKIKSVSADMLKSCESSFQTEIKIMFREVYNNVLKCKRAYNTNMIEGRSLAGRANSMRLCPIANFGRRHLKAFQRRSITLADPVRAVEAFRNIGQTFQTVGDSCIFKQAKVTRIACDLTHFPRNEAGCQLAQRTKRVISGLHYAR